MVVTFALLSFSSYGQGLPTIAVKNQSACTVYYRLLLTDVSMPCSPAYSSTITSIAPSTSIVYTNTTYPGSIAGANNFIMAVMYDGGSTCMTTGVTVGEGGCGYTTADFLPSVKNAAPLCINCNTVKASWLPVPVGGTEQTLLFR